MVWTTNTLTTSKKVADTLWNTERNEVDFNLVSPIPDDLEIDFPTNDYAIVYYLTDRLAIDIHNLNSHRKHLMKRMINTIFSTPEEIYTSIFENRDLIDNAYSETLYRKGKKYVENYKKYGAPSQYEWCQIYWGTFGNAFCSHRTNMKDGEVKLSFRTESSSPLPLLEKLCKRFPKKAMQLESHYDDGYYFNYQNLNGNLTCLNEGHDATTTNHSRTIVVTYCSSNDSSSVMNEINQDNPSIQNHYKKEFHQSHHHVH